MLDPRLSREIIMDNYQYPHNKTLVEDEHYAHKHMASDSCIDDITVQAKVKDGVVEDVRFDGQACTISTASTSIMARLLEGKTVEEAEKIIEAYFNMIYEKDFDEDLLEDAVAFQTVGQQANRINCATIGWKAIRDILEGEKHE